MRDDLPTANIRVQGYVQLIKIGKYEEAVKFIMEDLPLPGSLGSGLPPIPAKAPAAGRSWMKPWPSAT